jgi:hypothetical protein
MREMSETGNVYQFPTAGRLRDPPIHVPHTGMWIALDDDRDPDGGTAAYGPTGSDEGLAGILGEGCASGSGGSGDPDAAGDPEMKALQAVLLLMLGMTMGICCLIAVPLFALALVASWVGRAMAGRV